MRPSPTSFESQGCKVPKHFWLEVASLALMFALGLFAVSLKLGRPEVMEWLAVRLLRAADRALGHAPAEYCVEFRADLPVEI